jgi:hypothetical protein
MGANQGLTRSEINAKIEELAAESTRLEQVYADLEREDDGSLLTAKKKNSLAEQLLAMAKETTALKVELILREEDEAGAG